MYFFYSNRESLLSPPPVWLYHSFLPNSSCKSQEIGMLMLRAREESSPLVFFKADIDTCSWQLKVKTFLMFMGH